MNLKHPYSLHELAASFDQPTAADREQLSSIKALAAEYKNSDSSNSCAESFDLIASLAKEYRTEQSAVLSGAPLRILTPAEARATIYRVNSTAKIQGIRAGVVTFEEIPLPNIPKLPSNYGFKGGAARLALAAILGRNVQKRKPRDWDLFRTGKGDPTVDLSLAKKYMPEDLQFGHGIEEVASIRMYLHTRDLTINQVALIDGKVVSTYAAIEDTINASLRATDFVRKTGDSVQGKISMKMLRMIAEARLEGFELKLADESFNDSVTLFDIALHLNRVLTRGTRAAQYYLELCMVYGYLETANLKIKLGEIIHQLQSKLPSKKIISAGQNRTQGHSASSRSHS